MNKTELAKSLADTLKIEQPAAERLAGKFILLGTKYRKNILRHMDGEHTQRQLDKTAADIKDLCDRLALRYKIVEDPRGPILRLYLGDDGDSMFGGCLVEDGL